VASSDFNAWIADFTTRLPVVADDLLDAIDVYLRADRRFGDYTLTDDKSALARIDRLTRLRTRLVAAHDSR
jgi:hypothetical protein